MKDTESFKKKKTIKLQKKGDKRKQNLSHKLKQLFQK